MRFKTVPVDISERLGARPLDFEFVADTCLHFSAVTGDAAPRLFDALEALNLHGAADLALAAVEWCLARTHKNVDPKDGLLRLQAGWASTVDVRYMADANLTAPHSTIDTPWSLSEEVIRRRLQRLCKYVLKGDADSARGAAFDAILIADHVCGRDEAFGSWLSERMRIKTASSPRPPQDQDYTFVYTQPATAQDLTLPSREERLAGLDPATNPYLRSAAEMAALGFVGDPYPCAGAAQGLAAVPSTVDR